MQTRASKRKYVILHYVRLHCTTSAHDKVVVVIVVVTVFTTLYVRGVLLFSRLVL